MKFRHPKIGMFADRHDLPDLRKTIQILAGAKNIFNKIRHNTTTKSYQLAGQTCKSEHFFKLPILARGNHSKGAAIHSGGVILGVKHLTATETLAQRRQNRQTAHPDQDHEIRENACRFHRAVGP